jgi:XTP/dITP diphosphohydrolase
MDLIIATNNVHKAIEIEAVLAPLLKGRFLTLKDAGIESNPVEDGTTFLENARIKACAARNAAIKAGYCANSFAVLADDSGLVVDALDGAPGIYSSRFAGEDGNDEANNALLLQKLADVADKSRTARFVCTLAYIDPDGTEVSAEGCVEGFIAHKLNGEGGFGYDPLFLPVEFNDGRTFGQATPDEKNSISHRARALLQLKDKLSD